MRFRYLIVTGAAALALYFSAAAALPSSPVADAAQKGDLASVKSLIQQKADVNAQQADGATALQWAAYRNDTGLADALIAAGADVRKANREGATPIYLASIQGSAPMLDRLLKAGGNPNETGPQGETPLMLASRTGNLDAMKVLLDHKADVNAKEELRGTTPLMFAASESHPDAVKLLIQNGADVNAAAKPDTGGRPRNNLANPRTQRLNSAFGANNGRAELKAGRQERMREQTRQLILVGPRPIRPKADKVKLAAVVAAMVVDVAAVEVEIAAALLLPLARMPRCLTEKPGEMLQPRVPVMRQAVAEPAGAGDSAEAAAPPMAAR